MCAFSCLDLNVSCSVSRCSGVTFLESAIVVSAKVIFDQQKLILINSDRSPTEHRGVGACG